MKHTVTIPDTWSDKLRSLSSELSETEKITELDLIRNAINKTYNPDSNFCQVETHNRTQIFTKGLTGKAIPINDQHGKETNFTMLLISVPERTYAESKIYGWRFVDQVIIPTNLFETLYAPIEEDDNPFFKNFHLKQISNKEQYYYLVRLKDKIDQFLLLLCDYSHTHWCIRNTFLIDETTLSSLFQLEEHK